ncbi:MAG: trigger factor [Acidimicrobiales bacterium]
MRATAEAVEGSKVRLSVQIDASEMDRALEQTVRKLSREVRVRGFRPGKVPRQVLEARLGGSAGLRDEALRDALPDFYALAVAQAELDPIAPPDIDLKSGGDGGAVEFDALVQVRPLVAVPGYAGLQVTIPPLGVTEEQIDAQLERLRENDGELVAVQREARDTDNLTINLHAKAPDGTEVIGVDDFVYEVGSGAVVAELDSRLRGSALGDVLSFVARPSSHKDELSFSVLVKEVKEKRLPEPTDQWVSESTEFATLVELRSDISERLRSSHLLSAQLAWRSNTLDALAGLVEDEEVPEVLVQDELNRLVHELGHRLEAQGISMDRFIEITGQDVDALLAEMRRDALRGVKTDLGLRAVAHKENIEVDDAEIDARVIRSAEQLEMAPGELRRRLDTSGRMSEVRSEQRKSKALVWLLDRVQLVDEQGKPASRDELRESEPNGRAEDSEVSMDTERDDRAAEVSGEGS